MELMTIKSMTKRRLIAALLFVMRCVLFELRRRRRHDRLRSLITHDPYFSVWSMNDHLTDDWPNIGQASASGSGPRIDGKPYRFAGAQPMSRPPANEVPAMKQSGLEVWPTRTVYHFEAAGLQLQLTFLTPALPHDREIYSRPVTYVSWEARSIDGVAHAVALYFDVTGQWVVNNPEQAITWSRFKFGELSAMAMGRASTASRVITCNRLGYVWAIRHNQVFQCALSERSKTSVVTNGTLPDQDDLDAEHLWWRLAPLGKSGFQYWPRCLTWAR
jgi:hypothetical protein